MSKDQDQLETDRWRALVNGDESALEWLFDNFSQSLFNYGMKVVGDRELVKDCIQDLFTDLWKDRSHLIIPDAPRLYLFKALKYKLVRDRVRHQKRVDLHKAQAGSGFELSVESSMILRQTALEHRIVIQEALHKLTARQREVLMLRYFEEMSYDEIAGFLEINRQSVYNLIFSALRSLKTAMLPEVNIYN